MGLKLHRHKVLGLFSFYFVSHGVEPVVPLPSGRPHNAAEWDLESYEVVAFAWVVAECI